MKFEHAFFYKEVENLVDWIGRSSKYVVLI